MLFVRKLTTRHPIGSLLSGGVLMVVGLLPLFLAELDRFSGISDFWKLVGVTFTAVGVIEIIWVVLHHSGRAKDQDEDVDEHEATQTWLKGLDIAIKCVGATALVVITHWFGVLTKQQEAKRLNAEKASQEWRQNTDRVSLLLEGINRDSLAARVAAVCVAGELLQETGQSSLSILQALYSVSMSDGDSTVQEAAKAFLPAIRDDAKRYNVIEAVLASTDVMQQETAKLRRSMQALEMIREHALNKSEQVHADELLTQLRAASVKEGERLVKEGGADAQAKLAELAPALVTAAADNSNAAQKEEAEKLVSALPSDVVQQTIAGLPVATVQHITPRVYLHIASEDQRERARAFQKELIAKNYIVPGIQNVAGKGYIPDTLEVRYFDPDSKSRAQEILGIIKSNGSNGAKDGRVSYVIPTANDLRISPDIKSHFEVWAGRNSF
jgi:hypothetical protein